MTVHDRSKLAEGADNDVLSVESVDGGGRRWRIDSQHELKIIDDDVSDVMNVHCMWHCLHQPNNQLSTHRLHAGFIKTDFVKKPNPLGFLFGFGLYWVLRFFIWMSSWEACWYWFNSSARLLLTITSTFRLSKNSQILYLLVVRSCKHNKEIFKYYWHDKLKLK